MVSVERIAGLREFGSLRQEWNALLRDSGSDNVNLSHEWITAWCETLGSAQEPMILRIRDEQGTIGYAPLMASLLRWRRFVPYRQILFLTDPWSDFGDFIIVREREAAFRAVFDYLASSGDWAELLLHNISDRSPNFPLFREIGQSQGELTESSPCYYIAMKQRPWEEFYQTTNKNFVRKDITRLLNHYAEHEWGITEHDAASLPGMIETFTALHLASQSRKGRGTFYNDPGFRAFLDRASREGEFGGGIKAYLLRIDRQPAAFVLGLDYRRTFHYWHIGFDPAFEKLSPSKVLLYSILRSGFELERWDEFNFMRGATDYKRRWASTNYTLFQLRLLNRRGMYGAFNKLRNKGRAAVAAST